MDRGYTSVHLSVKIVLFTSSGLQASSVALRPRLELMHCPVLERVLGFKCLECLAHLTFDLLFLSEESGCGNGVLAFQAHQTLTLELARDLVQLAGFGTRIEGVIRISHPGTRISTAAHCS